MRSQVLRAGVSFASSFRRSRNARLTKITAIATKMTGTVGAVGTFGSRRTHSCEQTLLTPCRGARVEQWRPGAQQRQIERCGGALPLEALFENLQAMCQIDWLA